MRAVPDNLERVHGCSLDAFRAEWLEPERPVVLTDATAAWPARAKWSRRWLDERFGDHPIRAYYDEDGLYSAWRRMRVSTTLGEVLRSDDPRTFIAADMVSDCPWLLDDVGIPPQIDPLWIEDQVRLFVQPRGHRTGLHWDSFNTLLAVLSGPKRVMLFSPDQFERLYPCAVTGPGDFTRGSWSRMDAFAPDPARFPAARDAEYVDVTVQAGETLLIPRHWWHAVENLGDPTIAVSIFVRPQGRPELTFYHDRRVILALALQVGALRGDA